MEQQQSSLEIVSKYTSALSSQNPGLLNSVCTDDWVLDFAHFDASGADPLSPEDSRNFWSSWFDAFPKDYDHEVTRTIAADNVVVTQWIFTGTFDGILKPPVADQPIQPTGKTVQFRAVSIYDIRDGLIERETIYMDLATIMVELGI